MNVFMRRDKKNTVNAAAEYIQWKVILYLQSAYFLSKIMRKEHMFGRIET